MIKWSSVCGTLLLLASQTVLCVVGSGDGAVIKGKVVARSVRSPKDVVVYLAEVPGDFNPPPVNPLMDQRDLIFTPHVLPVLVGTTVVFPNSDEVRHNVFSPSPNKRFNLGTYPKGVVREVVFEKLGVITLLCNVHQEMSAYIVVLQNPFSSTTGRDGKFLIEGVPPGRYRLKTWHEKLKTFEQEVTVSNGETLELEISLRR